jgi:succinate dehydrogenase/fumarate reductase cytochrome b subunit
MAGPGKKLRGGLRGRVPWHQPSLCHHSAVHRLAGLFTACLHLRPHLCVGGVPPKKEQITKINAQRYVGTSHCQQLIMILVFILCIAVSFHLFNFVRHFHW